MTSINVNEKIKDIKPFELLKVNISYLFRVLLDDFNQNMDQKTFDHSYEKIASIIQDKYKSFCWGDVRFVFDEISAGRYSIRNISVVEIMKCMSDYKNKKIELNRFEIENKENEIRKQNMNIHKLPFGTAVLFRMQKRKEGNLKYENMPIKEIAELIKKGEIKYNYEKSKMSDTIDELKKRLSIIN